MPKQFTIPKKNNRANQSSLSLDAFVNAKSQRFVNTKKIENKRKVKKIVGQFHQIKQQSEKKSQDQPSTEKSFYDMVFSGEVDVDAYNNYGVVKKPDEDHSDAELNNDIESYVRERPVLDRDNGKNTTNNKNNRTTIKQPQNNSADESEDMDGMEEDSVDMKKTTTKAENKKSGKSKKGKKKDFTYKIPEFQEARQRYEAKQAEIEAARQAKAERLEKLEHAKKGRLEVKKKLAMKTSKGQPIMKNQLDLFLTKLQKKS